MSPFTSGDPVKMAMVNIDATLPRAIVLKQMSDNLTALLPYLSVRTAMSPSTFPVWPAFYLLQNLCSNNGVENRL